MKNCRLITPLEHDTPDTPPRNRSYDAAVFASGRDSESALFFQRELRRRQIIDE
jgi:hypothetical protein